MRNVPRDISSIFGDNGKIKYNTQELIEIETSQLLTYPGHSFKAYSEVRMQKMVESAKIAGIVEPIIAYEENNKYYILAGYNRVRANQLAGYDKIQAIIKRGISKLQQVEIMNFSNFFQRGINDYSYSETAKSFKMEYDALIEDKKQKNDNCEGNVVRQYLADLYEMTDSQMQRHLSLNKLTEELLDCLDIGRIKFTVALEFTSLSIEQQKIIENFLLNNDMSISVRLAKIIKNRVVLGSLENLLEESPPIKKDLKVVIDKKLENYLPKGIKVKETVEKSLYLSQKQLPIWFENHGISLKDMSLNDYMISLLDRIYEVNPTILK